MTFDQWAKEHPGWDTVEEVWTAALASRDEEVKKLVELLQVLSSAKVCSFSLAQDVACRCCNAHSKTWDLIPHTADCDVLTAQEILASHLQQSPACHPPAAGRAGRKVSAE